VLNKARETRAAANKLMMDNDNGAAGTNEMSRSQRLKIAIDEHRSEKLGFLSHYVKNAGSVQVYISQKSSFYIAYSGAGWFWRSFHLRHRERWGAGVEYHFQEIS